MMHSTSPGMRSKETPLTAATVASRLTKLTWRSLDLDQRAGRCRVQSGMLHAPAVASDWATAACVLPARLWPDAGSGCGRRQGADGSVAVRAPKRRAASVARSKPPRQSGQRVRKRQPEGGLIGLGGSPASGGVVDARRRVDRQARGEQRLRVGMPRAAVDRLDRADLDDLAEIHHQHAVGDILDDVRSCEMNR